MLWVLRNLFARLCGWGALVSPQVDRRTRVALRLPQRDALVAVGGSLYELGIDFLRLTVLLAAIHVVPAKVGICVRCPEQVHKGGLTGTREDGLEATWHRWGIGIVCE